MPFRPQRTAYRRERPAPRKAAGSPPPLNDDIIWTRIVEPRERYRVIYIDRDNALSEREVELLKIGNLKGTPYLGVMHGGKFKTFRTDRVVGVLEQLTQGHEPSIRAQPTYATRLPAFPIAGAVYKMPTIALSRRNQTWTVDLNLYTCKCPEKRIRAAAGYEAGQLGYVCPHMARAILDHLPAGTPGWLPEVLAFLADPRKMHVHNLT